MIPLRLSVRNFLCYRDHVPPLDFRGIHVACLCGAIGHGKFTLLDAMTWCLWGQARAATQSHNDLIAYGESECRVELDFLARGQEYRAIRRRRHVGQGRTEVDLFILDDAGHARSMSGNSVRETNWKIQTLVGMDYTTFVNTAFLRQGRSDEFTRKTPAERKAVLSSVLDLGLYETLQGSAAGQRNHWHPEVVRVEGGLAQNRSLLEAVTDPAKELGEIATKLVQVGQEAEARSATADHLRDTVSGLRQKRDEAAVAGHRIKVLRTNVEQSEATVTAIVERIAHSHAMEERTVEIYAGVRKLEAEQTEMDRLQTARVERDRRRDRRNDLQAVIDRTRTQLAAEATQLEKHVDDVLRPATAQADELSRKLLAVAEAEMALVSERSVLEAEICDSAGLEREVALAQADLNRCIAEGRELRSKQRDIQSADAVSPLCRTPLTEDACGDIASWYENEIQAKLTRHSEITLSLHDLSANLEGLQPTISEREPGLTQRQQRLQHQRGRLEEAQRQCEEAAEQLATSLPRLDRLKLTLAENDFAVEQRTALVEVEKASAQLGYDERRLHAATERVRSLQNWNSELTTLQDARRRLPQDSSSLAQIRRQLTRLNEELQIAKATLNEAQEAAADLPEREIEAATADQAMADLLAERDALLARQGRLQGDAERRVSYLEEIDALESRRASSSAEQGVYADLYQAFGRGGVPAMLIDAAVPSIEAEANLLLARMTDSRLAVKLETQRVRQSGNVAETLGIRVSDELGSRSYDLFSGGEAFRINLALRIAMSKVLAQRIRLPLPALFIDEGFGTQDAAGRERIVDAIAAIHEDFEKIIVITHLDDLKDLFPVRIEVLKTGAGSQFWLS